MKLLEKDYKDGMGLEEGAALLVKALEKGLDEKEQLDLGRLDFAFIEEGKKFERVPKQKIKSFLGKK